MQNLNLTPRVSCAILKISLGSWYLKENILKDYVVDLEIAKELKENGFPQNTFFIWHCYKTPEWCEHQNTLQYCRDKK